MKRAFERGRNVKLQIVLIDLSDHGSTNKMNGLVRCLKNNNKGDNNN